MQLTDRVIKTLRLLRRVKFATTALLRDQVIPEDDDGSLTRSLLRRMEACGWAKRFKACVNNPLTSAAAPVWTPTEQGCAALATHLSDMTLLLDARPNISAWQNFAHWVSVSQQVLKIDDAFARQVALRLGNVYFEHDIINHLETDPAKKFRLYTVVSESPRRIISACDWAFEVITSSQRRAYVCEFETGSEESPQRCAAKKAPGHAGLAREGLFRKCFPEAADMRVLVFCPNRAWMHCMRNSLKGKPGWELWRFCVTSEVGDNFLTAALFYTCDSGPLTFGGTPAPSGPAPGDLACAVEGGG